MTSGTYRGRFLTTASHQLGRTVRQGGVRSGSRRHGVGRVDRWRALDGATATGHDGPVTPPPAAQRGEAASAAQRHEDALLRLLYEQHAGPLLVFVSRLTGGDQQRAE